LIFLFYPIVFIIKYSLSQNVRSTVCATKMSMDRNRIRSGFWPFLAGMDRSRTEI